MRVCSKCKVPKDESEFSARTLPSGKLGLRSHCKGCCSQTFKTWTGKNYESRKAVVNAARSEKYSQNPIPAITRAKEYAAKNPDKVKNANLLRLYGVSLLVREEMFEKQGGRCAICKHRRKLGIDHDHSTGKVRALLCSPCNTALGLLQDSPDLALEASKYLTQHKT